MKTGFFNCLNIGNWFKVIFSCSYCVWPLVSPTDQWSSSIKTRVFDRLNIGIWLKVIFSDYYRVWPPVSWTDQWSNGLKRWFLCSLNVWRWSGVIFSECNYDWPLVSPTDQWSNGIKTRFFDCLNIGRWFKVIFSYFILFDHWSGGLTSGHMDWKMLFCVVLKFWPWSGVIFIEFDDVWPLVSPTDHWSNDLKTRFF